MKIITPIVGLVTPPLIAAVCMATMVSTGGEESWIAWGLIPVFYVFSFFAAVCFGMPAFFLFRHLKMITWWSSVIVGLLIGALVGVIARLPSTPHVHDVVIMVPVGALAAFGFWLIWRFVR